MSPSRRSFLTGASILTASTLVAPTWLAGTAAASPAPPSGPRPQQSPIALSTRRALRSPELPALVVDYPESVDLRVRYVSRDADEPDGCTTRGREETIEAEVPAGVAAVRLGDVRYELRQFHFHTPSEHVLDGHRFPLEQHFVHAGPNGETLVLGLFLTGGGRGGSLQDRVLGDLPDECGEEVEVPDGELAAALPSTLSTFRYPGSLTTAPNTEGVSWLVLHRHRRVAQATLAGFRRLFPEGDARDLQPLDGRVVRYRPQH